MVDFQFLIKGYRQEWTRRHLLRLGVFQFLIKGYELINSEAVIIPITFNSSLKDTIIIPSSINWKNISFQFLIKGYYRESA